MGVKILYIRSLPLTRDSRSTKMVAEYRKRGHTVTSLVWSRGEEAALDADTVTCTAKGAYGQKLRGLTARLRWMWFLATWMLRNRFSFDVVHAVDLDTALVAVPLSRLLRKPVIYDAFDHVAAIVGGGIAGAVLGRIEHSMISLSAIAVFPDPIRLEQYGLASRDRVSIIGNIPDVSAIAALRQAPVRNGPLRLVYIGTLESKHRGLEFLPDLCAQRGKRIDVVVGGTGELHPFFEAAATNLSNLTYLGHQDYRSALEHMAQADCLYGPYLLSAPAHRYASPNKMYEHLALGKPLITNAGTPPAALVAEVGSGFLFDGSARSLCELIANLDRAMCEQAGKRGVAAWRAEYAHLRSAQLSCYFRTFDRVTEGEVSK